MQLAIKYYAYCYGSMDWRYFKVNPLDIEKIEMVYLCGSMSDLRIIHLDEFLIWRKNASWGGPSDKQAYTNALFYVSEVNMPLYQQFYKDLSLL